MSALVSTILDTQDDFTVIATSPAQMETAQRSLILWAARSAESTAYEKMAGKLLVLIKSAPVKKRKATPHRRKNRRWRVDF